MDFIKILSKKYPRSFSLLAALALVVTMPLLIGAVSQTQNIRQNAQVIMPSSQAVPVIDPTPSPFAR